MLKPSDWLLDPGGVPGFERHEVVAHVAKPPMVSHTEHLHLRLPKRYGLVNITDHVAAALAPYGEDYEHHRTGEDNGDAHLKSFLTNHQLVAPVTNGALDFGTWQRI